jgi:hypothetical protein
MKLINFFPVKKLTYHVKKGKIFFQIFFFKFAFYGIDMEPELEP